MIAKRSLKSSDCLSIVLYSRQKRLLTRVSLYIKNPIYTLYIYTFLYIIIVWFSTKILIHKWKCKSFLFLWYLNMKQGALPLNTQLLKFECKPRKWIWLDHTGSPYRYTHIKFPQKSDIIQSRTSRATDL